MTTRDSSKPGIASAVTDLQLSTAPDIGNPARNNVFLTNSNTARSIVANIAIAGSDNFDLTTLSRLHKRTCYPRDFEVRVPPGGRKYVGRDRITKFDLIRLPPDPSETRLIISSYSIAGARYVVDETEPLPQPPTDPNACLFMYRAPIENEGQRGLVYVVNVNHLYGVEFSAKPTSAGNQDWFSAAIPPTGQLLVQDGLNPTDAWEVIKARFFEHTPPSFFSNTKIRRDTQRCVTD